jgi:hypothetical protein
LNLESVSDQLLSKIELTELQSLKWGYVDGSMSKGELDQLAQDVIADLKASFDGDSLTETLVEDKSLIEINVEGEFRYRSRFAEGVRLITQLRQWMWKKNWVSAPNLVSDFRVDARPRMFPKRNLDFEFVSEKLIEFDDEFESRLPFLRSMLTSDEGLRSLSQFQVETSLAVLSHANKSRGIVITAGTGTGKTLAFYLPMLLSITEHIAQNDFWVKTVALYPRTELLKDQFTEAFRLTRTLDKKLEDQGKRKIRMGTVFGSTPRTADTDSMNQAKWEERSGSYICPFLLCPSCGSELVWSKEDLQIEIERLSCTSETCDGVVTNEELSITRTGSGKNPPDIIFATAESLNRRMSDLSVRRLFGIHPNKDKRLKFILLDEIHTYTGMTGAQVALLLRRWKWALKARPKIVGLSATLEQPVEFFEQLTGIREHEITHVEPSQEDLEPGPLEYQLILRGDPASKRSLLSTSIQTIMLITRLLDPLDDVIDSESSSRFGSRIFAFSDDLDIVNRLYDDLSDAEGLGSTRNGVKTPLAALRAGDNSDPVARDQYGQNWKALEHLRESIATPLRVSRTSSQDSGVDARAEVVIASGSLEVGFDDPYVGAVLQHKAPYGLAAFAQRKGRAGRSTNMRPWMITVLSDYGRDRIAFQNYEQYFDVVVPPKALPIHNRYILKIQSVFAFFDWLATSDASKYKKYGWWWYAADGISYRQDTLTNIQRALLKILTELQDKDKKTYDSFFKYLSGALGVRDIPTLEGILWSPPRSVILEVLPTLERRLLTEWHAHPALGPSISEDLKSPPGPPHPLPDFIPSTLFGDLDLPEVNVQLEQSFGREVRVVSMPVVRCLKTFAPGRVTRRFGTEHAAIQHWIPVPLESGTHKLDIARFCERVEPVGKVSYVDDGKSKEIQIFRPWTITAKLVGRNEVSQTSNSFLKWYTSMETTGEPITLAAPSSGRWKETVGEIRVCLNRLRSPLITRRFATGADANVSRSGQDYEVHVDFESGGVPAALGIELEVDSMIVNVKNPDVGIIAERAKETDDLKSWKVAYFRDRVERDETLAGLTNTFQRGWICDLYLAALTENALVKGVTLAAASEHIREQEFSDRLSQVAKAIFQSQSGELSESDDSDRPELVQTLVDLLENPKLESSIRRLATQLWEPDESEFAIWLKGRLHESVGQGLMEAAISMAPLHATDDSIYLDLTDDGSERLDRVWISESTIGGTGVVEEISRQVSSNPAKFLEAFESAVAPGEFEVLSHDLTEYARLAVTDEKVKNKIEEIRSNNGRRKGEKLRVELNSLLSARGVSVNQTFAIAVSHRLLRGGMTSDYDRIVVDLIELWDDAEAKTGISIDLRVFSYLASVHSKHGPRVKNMIDSFSEGNSSPDVVVGVLSGILWQRPAEIRRYRFNAYNPFSPSGFTDPSLVRALANIVPIMDVDIAASDWSDKVRQVLSEMGIVRLTTNIEKHDEFRESLHQLIANPIDSGYLQFFPNVTGIARTDSGYSATLMIKERV